MTWTQLETGLLWGFKIILTVLVLFLRANTLIFLHLSCFKSSVIKIFSLFLEHEFLFFKLLCTLQIKKKFIFIEEYLKIQRNITDKFYSLFYTLTNKILGLCNIFKIKIIQVITKEYYEEIMENYYGSFEFLCLLQEFLGMETWVDAQRVYSIYWLMSVLAIIKFWHFSTTFRSFK